MPGLPIFDCAHWLQLEGSPNAKDPRGCGQTGEIVEDNEADRVLELLLANSSVPIRHRHLNTALNGEHDHASVLDSKCNILLDVGGVPTYHFGVYDRLAAAVQE